MRVVCRQISSLLLLVVLTFSGCGNNQAAGFLAISSRPQHIGAAQQKASSSGSQLLSSLGADEQSSESMPSSRRKLLQDGFKSVAALATAAALTTTSAPQTALADDSDELIDVYFGCGCFWHVQHEFVELEKSLLKRSDLELTARSGYAGGKAGMQDGKVCYHNAARIADYGTLGHAEVVSMQIPVSAFSDFAAEYCSLFSKDGYRPDQLGDRGPEYRNLVGIPGGIKSPLAKQLVDASIQNGDKLDFAKGKGDDPDARGLAFIMDTAEYPFYVAEQYHQFHDGFNFGENYPNSYNDLAGKLAKEGKLGQSACPNGLIGLGALGL